MSSLFSIVLLLALATASPGHENSLELGVAVERELAASETHSYALAFAADQYARLTVEQKGIDVVVAFYDPDGSMIVQVDSPNGAHGPEPVALLVVEFGHQGKRLGVVIQRFGFLAAAKRSREKDWSV